MPVCFQLSYENCTIFSKRIINHKSVVQIKLMKSCETHQEPEWYDFIPAKVNQAKKLKDHLFIIKLKFWQMPSDLQGVPQILNPELFQVKEKRILECSKNSLLGEYLQCPICLSQDVAYWKLRVKSIRTGRNIFGVPIYLDALSGFDFCNYNLLKVITCPQCFFSSHVSLLFRANSEALSQVDTGEFTRRWSAKHNQRSEQIHPIKDSLFSDQRTVEAAIVAYQLALETHELCYDISQDISEKRKIVALLLFRAEIYMENGNREEAEADLKFILGILEEIWRKLDESPTIRAALLLSLIYLYFQEMPAFSKYMTFLLNFNSERKIAPDSPVGKVLKSCIDSLNKAYEYRDSFDAKKLKKFQIAW